MEHSISNHIYLYLSAHVCCPKEHAGEIFDHVSRMYHGLKKQLLAMCNDLESEIHVRSHFN